jgi:Family of unknown function (DUF5681)
MTMGDYEVGRGKPPKHSRFKPGNNANPKGRPKRKPTPEAIAGVIDTVLNGVAEYRERGQSKKAKRRVLTIKTHIKLALGGNLKSIEALLLLREHALTSGDTGVHRLEITDWLPDYPGQTGEQKTLEFAAQTSAEVRPWWKDVDVKSEDNDK